MRKASTSTTSSARSGSPSYRSAQAKRRRKSRTRWKWRAKPLKSPSKRLKSRWQGMIIPWSLSNCATVGRSTQWPKPVNLTRSLSWPKMRRRLRAAWRKKCLRNITSQVWISTYSRLSAFWRKASESVFSILTNCWGLEYAKNAREFNGEYQEPRRSETFPQVSPTSEILALFFLVWRRKFSRR